MNTLWFFWKSAKYVVPQVKFVLYRMDEKWFYVVFNHTMDKVVTSIGLGPVKHYVQHKSHVGKEIYIVVTGYEVLDNDITKGGKAFPVALV